MNIPGLLIEYLVVGSSALVWLFPLLGVPIVEKSLSFEKAAALAPALYVLGMLVDFVAFFLVTEVPSKDHSLKALVRKDLQKDEAVNAIVREFPATGGGRNAKFSIKLQRFVPDLKKELDLRSSRDRIARSTVINLLCLAAVLAIKLQQICAAVTVLGLAMVALFMWIRHERSTSRFEFMAYAEALHVENQPRKQNSAT